VTVVSLVIGGVVLAAMIAIAAYGWTTLPADARVPVHHGVTSYNNYVSKTAGLILWPAAGALICAIYIILFAVVAHAAKPGHRAGAEAPIIILPLVLVLLAAFQWGAIRVARRNAAGPLR
jgi:hypothetical protein